RILNSLAVLSGYETARKLLRTYGSLKEVFSLSIEQLKSIEGIGEARAKRLFRLFNLKYEEKEIGAGEKND
ncbi:MAG: helix-hairpin-helix domain-containing protein, partial [Fervidicoccaceae archaeon]